MTDPSCALFDRSRGIHEATFVERPNRFLVRCDLEGAVVEAHCPNPGRMLEILLLGTPLLLQKRPDRADRRGAGKRPLKYSLVAARHRGILVPLASARANDLAERIVLPLLFPDARSTRREITMGKSRLDFLIELDEQGKLEKQARRGASSLPGAGQLFLEVKACTLVAEGTAMFPDAPTLRGLKHLEELESLSAQGRAAGILFLLMNPRARRLVPNLHTDPAFTSKLLSLREKIWMRAVSIRTAENGRSTVASPDVPVDLTAAAAVLEDSGAYLLIIKVPGQTRFAAGSLGQILLMPGWYVYAGSGRKNLSARIARHQRRRKKLHWHIDYLLACVRPADVTGLPIRSRHDLECALAREVAILAEEAVPGFGCSDCACRSHLFRFVRDPLGDRNFLDLLLHYRHKVALA